MRQDARKLPVASDWQLPGTAALFEYIEVFYKLSRRHFKWGYNSPVQFLQNRIRKHVVQQSIAAYVRPEGNRDSMRTSDV